MKVIVMGVSGCGKTSLGQALAEKLSIPFVDGDDHHPQSNRDKMAAGIPLNDQDRVPWLQVLNRRLLEADSLVVACSALTPMYRHHLSQGISDAVYLFLKVPPEELLRRLEARKGHFFKGAMMLQSQLNTLVEPTHEEVNLVNLDGTLSIDKLVRQLTQSDLTRLISEEHQ